MVAITPELSRAGFRDAATAARNLARVAQLAPAAVTEALTPVLREVADPDMALNQFVRLLEQDAGLSHALAQHPVLTYYAATIFGHTQWLGETVVQWPELLSGMLRDKALGRALGRDEYAERLARFQSRNETQDTPTLLARFKRRECVRIMLRDVLGFASLSETTAELSAVADVLIAESLRVCDQALQNRYGTRQVLDPEGRLVGAPFAVLALGKLGGNELNYSSDIDLLYLYGDGEAPPGAAMTNREYFIRLSQEVTAMLSQSTRDGVPYRIDLRLRPQGTEGELAVPLTHALDYYAKRAADWELQALIKVRHAAGDQKLGREFIARVRPLVYTETLNFAAIETAVLSGEKMQSRRRQSAVARPGVAAQSAVQHNGGTGATPLDVKLDRGGIRDIEFLVQCLQRVYGGRERWLRSGGTMFSLQKLHDKNHITGRDFHELTNAYEFLRTVEHRLQLRLGQQVHQLPSEDDRLVSLARGLSPKFLAQPSTALLIRTLRDHMTSVRRIYDAIIHQQQVAERAEHDTEFRLRAIVPLGREATQNEILQRLAMDAPKLYRLTRQQFFPHASANLFKFLGAAFTSAERYVALLESQEYFENVLQIVSSSDYLTELLVRYPEQVAILAGIHEVSGRAGERLLEMPEAQGRSAFVDFVTRLESSPEERLAMIRRHCRARVFASGARDVLQRRDVFDSLAETTAAAIESMEAALALAQWPEGLAVFALGRLGTGEFDILSDADLVFVRDETLDGVVAQDAAVRLMQALSAYTRDGSLFPVDARLRPHGTAGELAVTPAELSRYFETEAQAWEALTWTKLRFVCGAEHTCRDVFSAAERLFQRWAAAENFSASLAEMRERLEKSDDPESLRTGAGALYDLDYVAGFLLVRLNGAVRIGGNLRQRMRALCQAGVLSEEDCRRLTGAAELFRSVEHAIRLTTGTARKTLPQGGHARDAVEGLVRAMLPGIADPVETAIRAAREAAREVFRRLLE